MDFQLDLINTKIECFEAYSIKELEKQIQGAIEINKALLLDAYAVQHNTVFHPGKEKMMYTAVVHFKLKGAV